MNEVLGKMYEKYVPQAVREYIDSRGDVPAAIKKSNKILREALEHLPECLRRMSNGRRVAVGKQGEGKANPPCDRP